MTLATLYPQRANGYTWIGGTVLTAPNGTGIGEKKNWPRASPATLLVVLQGCGHSVGILSVDATVLFQTMVPLTAKQVRVRVS